MEKIKINLSYNTYNLLIHDMESFAFHIENGTVYSIQYRGFPLGNHLAGDYPVGGKEIPEPQRQCEYYSQW